MVRVIGIAVALIIASGCGPQPEGAERDPIEEQATDGGTPGQELPAEGTPDDGVGGEGAADDDPVAAADDSPAPPVPRAPDCDDLRISPPVDGPLSDDAEVAAAQQHRAESGLPSDEATVVEVMATVEGPYSFHFPHTPEEFESLMARNDPGVGAGELRGWAYEEAGERFGGLWMESHEDVLTVAFTEDTARLRASAADRFDAEIVIVEVDHTLSELRALQEEIGDVMRAGYEERGGDPGEGDIAGTGIRENLNRVSIHAIGGENTAVAISERFGSDMICLDLQPVPGPEHAEVADWAPVDGAEVDTAATEIELIVFERACASGEPATGRIADPEIHYGDDQVLVTIRVIPRTGGQNCQGNPSAPFTLELDEPIGDRILLDGGRDPAAPPTIDQ